MSNEISLIQIFKILKRYLVLIAIITITVATAITIVLSVNSKPSYVASAKIIINNSYGDNILTPSGNINELNYTTSVIPTIVDLLSSNNDFLDNVSENAGVRISSASMQSMISYKYSDTSKIVVVTVSSGSKDTTSKICSAYTDTAPDFISHYNLGELQFVDSFRTPRESSTSTLKIALSSFVLVLTVTCGVFLIIGFMKERFVTENTDLSGRYNLPIIGTIPSFNGDSVTSDSEEDESHEK